METGFTDVDVLVQEVFRRAPSQPIPLPTEHMIPPRETINVEDVVAIGRKHDWIFWEMPHRGIPESTVTHDDIEYRVLEPNDNIPDWVRQRIDAVRTEIPEVTFLCGLERGVNQLEVVERGIQQASEAAQMAVKAAAMAVVVIIAAVAIMSVLAALVTVCAIALAVGAVGSAIVLDPQIVCVVGVEEKWVSLAVWYD